MSSEDFSFEFSINQCARVLGEPNVTQNPALVFHMFANGMAANWKEELEILKTTQKDSSLLDKFQISAQAFEEAVDKGQDLVKPFLKIVDDWARCKGYPEPE